jgi:hypothetical protein
VGRPDHASNGAARVLKSSRLGSQNKPFVFNVPLTEHAACRSASVPRPQKLITRPYPNFLFCGTRGTPSFPPVGCNNRQGHRHQDMQSVLAEIRGLRNQGMALRGFAATLNHRLYRTRRSTAWRLESVARVIIKRDNLPRPRWRLRGRFCKLACPPPLPVHGGRKTGAFPPHVGHRRGLIRRNIPSRPCFPRFRAVFRRVAQPARGPGEIGRLEHR